MLILYHSGLSGFISKSSNMSWASDGLTPDLLIRATGLKHHSQFYEEWREERERFLPQPSDTTSCWRPSARSCTFTLFTHGGPRIMCVRMHFKERRRDDAKLQLLIKISPTSRCIPLVSYQISTAQALYHCFYYYHCNFSFHLCTKKTNK